MKRLVVVGNGRPEKYEDVISRYGIWGVDFVGMVPAEQLPRYYASCDLFCAPSIHGESFGIILLEAMASGKPVIASDIPGYASVMTDGREGLLTEPGDPTSIALAIVRLLSDDALKQRVAEQGLKTAAHYAWPSVAKRVLQTYDAARERSLVSGRRDSY